MKKESAHEPNTSSSLKRGGGSASTETLNKWLHPRERVEGFRLLIASWGQINVKSTS